MDPARCYKMNRMEEVTYINIGRDFSDTPGGRYKSDGEGNAEDFRERFLIPVLDEGKKAVVLLDDAEGFPSSFLEETFGGLVRLGYTIDMIKKSIEVRATQPAFARFIPMIDTFLERAARTYKPTSSA